MKVDWVNNIELTEQYEGVQASVVGGTPRDFAMGLNSNDVDIVVTGVTVQEMQDRGFTHIMSSDDNSDVPVFVDDLGREVAIARSEISTGDGYDDFEMDIVNPDLSHKEALSLDLERRDLTINAISVNIRTGEIFDPYNGLDDIEKGVIRHVSPAFAEDPLRVLRAARYAIRFGFNIHPETMEMMKSLSDKIESLPQDRFGLELIKALSQGNNPREFFDILSDVDALDKAYPEIHELKSVPAGPEKYHQEGSAYEHTMRVLTEMYNIRGNDTEALLAALFHDIGKIETDEETLPHHYNHERDGKSLAKEIRKDLQISRDFKGVLSLSARVHMNIGNIDNLNAGTVIDIADKIRDNPLSVDQLADLSVSDQKGRIPQGSVDRENIVHTLNTAINVLNDIKANEALKSRGYTQKDIGNNITGEKVGSLIRQDRVEELRERLN